MGGRLNGTQEVMHSAPVHYTEESTLVVNSGFALQNYTTPNFREPVRRTRAALSRSTVLVFAALHHAAATILSKSSTVT